MLHIIVLLACDVFVFLCRCLSFASGACALWAAAVSAISLGLPFGDKIWAYLPASLFRCEGGCVVCFCFAAGREQSGSSGPITELGTRDCAEA